MKKSLPVDLGDEVKAFMKFIPEFKCSYFRPIK